MAEKKEGTNKLNTSTEPIKGEITPPPKYTSKCLYFPDRQKLGKLEHLLDKYPRTTLSTIVAQLLEPLAAAIESAEKSETGNRRITLNCQFWV